MAFVLAKRNGTFLENIEVFVCDGEDDLANLPDAPAGSTAHCVAEGTNYILGSDGTWAKQPEGGGGGGGGGGGDVEVEALSVTANGTYTAPEGKAYSPVTVNVGGDSPDPTDGKTHIWISIPEHTPDDYLKFNVRFKQSEDNAVTVDWGDGTTPETFSGTSASTRSHTYAQAGDYEITLSCETGKTYGFGGSSSYSIYGSTGSTNSENAARVQRIFFGTGVTEIGEYTMNKCYALQRVTLPSGITSIDTYASAYCSALRSVTIPSGVTSIGSNAFQYCYNLLSITVPSGITSIGNSAFSSCYALHEFHIAATTPPTLGGTSVFSSAPRDLVIFVPYSADHSVLNAYKNATNWSTHASKMVEESA